MDLSSRYDRFQNDAVAAIVADFKSKPSGRFLLVIPTGGGKTRTAVRAIVALFAQEFLSPNDRVLWVVHRDELRTQADATFTAYTDVRGRVDIIMVSELKSYLRSHPEVRFAVVDEAHHVAAQSYQPLLAAPHVGILGLTATPSRHDGQPLQFDRESYSIGFPDLVDLGVLLRPNIVSIAGGTFDLADIGADADLEVLNNEERNQQIIAGILHNRSKLRKIIIYVGTKKHAQNLYQLISESDLKSHYDDIGLILGSEIRRRTAAGEKVGEARSAFVDAMKASRRSIVVNVDVLTEGYDDRSVNAIVMARPTNSKLVYVQAVGRAVRRDPTDPDKQAYVVEVSDVLPNIQYRIDNRWLFSDISDALEPDVKDEFYPSLQSLAQHIAAVFDEYNVPASLRSLPSFSARDRISLLLFKVYEGPGQFHHVPIVITNDTRQAAADFFNFLSTWMKRLIGQPFSQMIGPVRSSAAKLSNLVNPETQKAVLGSMENAWHIVSKSALAGPAIQSGSPWLTFVAFRLRPDVETLSDDLLTFTDDMLNRDGVRDTLRLQNYVDGDYLVRLPLPLKGSWGQILPPADFTPIQETVNGLASHRDEQDALTQWTSANTVLGAAKLLLENRHHRSLWTVVRDQPDFFRELKRK